MRRLLLVRHGLTAETGKRLSGWTAGLHLTDEGREQAAKLALRLAPVPIDAVYSSPLERCQQTAAAIAGPRGIDVVTLEEVGEVRYGDWTGKELKELAGLDLWRTVQRNPASARFPSGESLYEMQARAVAALERLREAHSGQTVLVCSHADVIKAAAAHYLGMHLDLYQRIAVAPASLTAFAFEPAPFLLRLSESGDNADLVPRPDPVATEPEAGREAASGEPGETADAMHPEAHEEPPRADP